MTITVNPVNDPPLAVNDSSYATDEDTPLNVATGGVLANDTDGGRSADGGAGRYAGNTRTVTLNADGTFSYTRRRHRRSDVQL